MRTIKEIMGTISEEKRDEAIKAIRSTKDLESFKKAVKEYGIEASDDEQEIVFKKLKLMIKKSISDADLDEVVGGTEDWGDGEIIDC